MEKENRRKNIVIAGRAEIDTQAPFRSVKEAVALFGETVLVGEIYANKLKEIRVAGPVSSPHPQSKTRTLTTELEEMKQNLQKTKEENKALLQSTKALREELERTKRELQYIKARQSQKHYRGIDNPEIEELKFIERQTSRVEDEEEITEEFEKRRFVKLASPPLLSGVIMSKEEEKNRKMSEIHSSSVKKTKRIKPLVPLIGWLFSRKKGNQEDDHSPILGY